MILYTRNNHCDQFLPIHFLIVVNISQYSPSANHTTAEKPVKNDVCIKLLIIQF
jgi:hypothetical protein